MMVKNIWLHVSPDLFFFTKWLTFGRCSEACSFDLKIMTILFANLL